MTPAEKSQRLIETASAALHAAPGHELNAVVLNKVLFYLDLATLRDQGEAVTGNSYIALRNGPVISKYPQRLIAKLESLGIARQDSRWDGAKPMVLEKCPTHFEFLSPDTMLLVSEVTDFFADSTSQAASDFSHKNPGWQIAWKHFRREGKPKAINLQIAMQQIVESDPWMETPLVDEAALLNAADAGLGDDW